MGKHSAESSGRYQHGKVLLLGAVTSGALAVVALGSAGAASASCASFSGINSSTGLAGKCTTSTIGDTAISIGTNSTAISQGGFNTAIAIGTNSEADAIGVGNSATVLGNNSFAYADGTLNSATVIGDNDRISSLPGAAAVGTLNRATVLGNNSSAWALGGKSGSILKGPENGGLNSALTVGNFSISSASGALKLGAALGDHKHALNGINNTP